MGSYQHIYGQFITKEACLGEGTNNTQKAAKSPKDVLGIAKEHGHEFTADKITELSKEELEGVAGADNKITNFYNVQLSCCP